MTIGTNKKLFAALLSLVFAVSMLFVPLSDSVWAAENEDHDGDAPNKVNYMLKAQSAEDEEDEEEWEEEQGDPWETGIGVHADPTVFEKNFDLTWEQKKYTIQEIERFIVEDAGITPEMSDLEKYYRLAVEGNKRAEYDWNFWGGRYFFEYYSHQWDSYGVLTERSVCAGIAIFYSHLCHAADLPCWFVRMDPKYLDHTISYIPDIHGNAYYVDVTEDMMFMSEKSNPFWRLDKDFSHITKNCDDYTFDYYTSDGKSQEPSGIKQYYDVPFAEWFDDFAKHNNPDKTYPTEEEYQYEIDDPEHVSYHDYRSNFVDETDVWFLDDFYRNPAAVKQKILNKEFVIDEEKDERLVNVSGVKRNYDCTDAGELEEAVAEDMVVEYFPSSKTENGEEVVVADTATLTSDDYDLDLVDMDDTTARFKVTGKGAYEGSEPGANTYFFDVRVNSAVVSKDPVPKKGLAYNGAEQVLIEPGEAENGVMQYARGDNDTDVPDESKFTAEPPTAADAGRYYVWYKVKGNDGYADSDPVCMEKVVKIAPIYANIIVDEEILRLRVGETATISPRIDNKVKATFTFTNLNDEVATVDEDGVVTAVSDGVAEIFVSAKLNGPNYEVVDDVLIIVRVGGGIDIDDTRVVLSKTTFTYNGKVQRPTIQKIKRQVLEEGIDYEATWSNKSSKNAGTYRVDIEGIGDYFGTTDATYTIKKAANPMKLKAKTVKVKYKSLKKKSKTIKRGSAFTVSNAKGTPSYQLVSAKKGKKSFKKKFSVNKKTGNVTVKKNLKKGTYNVKVKVKAAGTANYKASGWKTVTFKVRVK